MATYNQVSYGSKDQNTVTELQKMLNQNGANLTVDGIFGSQTQQAVKDYQKANNLTVDGIVGNQTWGTLTKASDSTQAPEETKAPTFEYKPYQPSNTVAKAETLLQQQLAQKPGGYQSTWQSQLNDTLQQILNREDFSYDINGDAMYQQYRDQFVNQGKLASMDAMGHAAALTGGYGNSFAQSAGQQAYQAYLQQLNEVVPELYGMALDQHNQETQDLYTQASLMAQQEDQDYGRYRDALNDYYTELDRLTNESRYQAEQDYSKWADDQSFNYQQYRDQIGDAQWQSEFDENKRRYDQQYAGSDSSQNGSFDTSDSAYDNGGIDNAGVGTTAIKLMQKKLGVTEDGQWGPESRTAAQKIYGISDPAELYKKLVGSSFAADGKSSNPNERATQAKGFTGSTYGEAAAYLKENGYSTSGLMTQSEWQRHKNSNSSAGGEHEARSYQEYLAAYIYGKTKA